MNIMKKLSRYAKYSESAQTLCHQQLDLLLGYHWSESISKTSRLLGISGALPKVDATLSIYTHIGVLQLGARQ